MVVEGGGDEKGKENTKLDTTRLALCMSCCHIYGRSMRKATTERRERATAKGCLKLSSSSVPFHASPLHSPSERRAPTRSLSPLLSHRQKMCASKEEKYDCEGLRHFPPSPPSAEEGKLCRSPHKEFVPCELEQDCRKRTLAPYSLASITALGWHIPRRP